MKIFYTDQDILLKPAVWLAGITTPSARPGFVNIQTPTDRVASMQPFGVMQTRPVGTDGPYEQFQMVGDKLINVDVQRVAAFIEVS